MNGRTWAVFIVIVVAVIGGMVYMARQDKLDVSDVGKDKAAGVLAAEDRNGNIEEHVLGKKDAKLIIVEYGDYQCPGCSTAAPKAKAVAEKYKDNVALIFRNFPIATIHPNARAAAAAAEAAGFQGKFWEMHDLIYANQDTWSQASTNDRTEIFLGYARQIGLKEEQFKEGLSDARITKKINFDVAIARTQGVTGTPTFYINGELVESTNDADYLENAVKEALKKAGVEVKEEAAQTPTE